MAEPSSGAIAAVAVMTSGTLTFAGSFYGVPAESMLAATLGAAISMAGARRYELTGSALCGAVGVFITSLSAAVFIGPLLGILADGLITKALGVDMPDRPMRAAGALLMGMGSQRLLSAGLNRVANLIENTK